MKFTFTKQPSQTLWLGEGEAEVTFSFEEIELNKVVKQFETFLLSCGYVLNGQLDFINDE